MNVWIDKNKQVSQPTWHCEKGYLYASEQKNTSLVVQNECIWIHFYKEKWNVIFISCDVNMQIKHKTLGK